MPHSNPTTERHLVNRIGWLRAAVLGANDGIVSVGSLIAGVAASSAGHAQLLIAGCAAWIAGAMSMAAGEYVSVSSQADTERADLTREQQELKEFPEAERRELAAIYVGRGLDKDLAFKVADALMERDALGAHARDELGISAGGSARPVQAALTSAAAFTVGALPPLLVGVLSSPSMAVVFVGGTSIALLALLGLIGARAGGAPLWRGVARVTFWGALAIVVTASVGHLVGMAV